MCIYLGLFSLFIQKFDEIRGCLEDARTAKNIEYVHLPLTQNQGLRLVDLF